MIESAHILSVVFTSGYIQTNPSKSNLMKWDPTNSLRHLLLMFYSANAPSFPPVFIWKTKQWVHCKMNSDSPIQTFFEPHYSQMILQILHAELNFWEHVKWTMLCQQGPLAAIDYFRHWNIKNTIESWEQGVEEGDRGETHNPLQKKKVDWNNYEFHIGESCTR